MPLVKEQDLIPFLTVPRHSMTDAMYDEAIMAMMEKQQHGNGKAVNQAGSLYCFGVAPDRIWTNVRSDLIPFELALANKNGQEVPSALGGTPAEPTVHDKLAESKAELAALQAQHELEQSQAAVLEMKAKMALSKPSKKTVATE